MKEIADEVPSDSPGAREIGFSIPARYNASRILFDNLAGEKSWRVIADAPHLMLHWRRGNEILREAVNWMAAQASRPVDDRKAETPGLAGNRCSAGAGLG